MNLKVTNSKTDGVTLNHQPSDDEIGMQEVTGKKTWKVIRKDPFGFCYIVPSKGPLPKDLDGAYTSSDMAHRAIAAYEAKIKSGK